MAKIFVGDIPHFTTEGTHNVSSRTLCEIAGPTLSRQFVACSMRTDNLRKAFREYGEIRTIDFRKKEVRSSLLPRGLSLRSSSRSPHWPRRRWDRKARQRFAPVIKQAALFQVARSLLNTLSLLFPRLHPGSAQDGKDGYAFITFVERASAEIAVAICKEQGQRVWQVGQPPAVPGSLSAQTPPPLAPPL